MCPAKRQTMTRDQCQKCLRCLEFEAYANVVSVLRAQGPLTAEKQKLLRRVAKVFRISNERHRAEVRRAVNDEKLAAIAERLNGPDAGTQRWTVEGRRAVPLLPRLKARSAFATLAHSLSLATVAANQRNPPDPREVVANESPVGTNVRDASIASPRPSPPDRDDHLPTTQVLESGANQRVDDPTDTSDAGEPCTARRKRKFSSPLSPAEVVVKRETRRDAGRVGE